MALAGCANCPLHDKSKPDAGAASSNSVTTRRPKLLRISATVDGSDKIVFTDESVRCKHKFWSPMTNVMFNGKPWHDLDHTPTRWLAFSDRLDLSKARIVKRQGRDAIALETTRAGFDLYLDDSPNGAAEYSVTIAIPYRK
jgi:hypothetical protein